VTGAWTIRDEVPGDEAAIAALTTSAFLGHPHSDGGEAEIVAGLRRDGDLSVSLLAEEGALVIGHAAWSPVAITDGASRWFGLGPVSVLPVRQRAGIGSALMRAGLERLREAGAMGCVVLGDPGYYGRFGFAHDPGLAYPGPPPAYFQRLVLAGGAPVGEVRYAPAFG